MHSWRIRSATPRDALALSVLAQATFRETFTHYPEEELAPYLAREYAPEIFDGYLADPAVQMYVAEEGGALLGYAKFGAYKLPLATTGRPIELHRVYVLASHKGRGIGHALMQCVFAEAARQKADTVYLGVWEKNYPAQEFYRHYGFTKVGEYDYPPVGNTVDREWIMSKPF